jgi:antitoxin component YwqK of YwqJK toxin-antitoxin module
MRPLIWLLLFLGGCYGTSSYEKGLVYIQIQDRNGLSETIGEKEKLKKFERADFLSSQPYQKVVRVYKNEGITYSTLTSYHKNGAIWQLLEGKEMRASGSYREWFPNGLLKIEATVIGGTADLTPSAQSSWLFDGENRVYNEEGALLASISYQMGVLEGKSTFYYPSGAIEKETLFHKDLAEGESVEYWENGTLQAKNMYEKGLRNGPSVQFFQDGTPMGKETWERGLLIEALYTSIDGRPLAQVEKGMGMRALFIEGRLYRLVEVKKGIPEGEVRQFTSNGSLESKWRERQGKKEGEETVYFEEEMKPKISIHWENGQIHGLVQTWYPNGKFESRREFSKNEKMGTSTGWYADGNLMLVEEYDQGDLVSGLYYKKGESHPISTVVKGNGTALIYDKSGVFLKKVIYQNGKPNRDET